MTEKAALADLVKWAEKRPAWQKDALRRLVTGEILDDQAIAELTQLCLDPSLAHVPISQSHIAAETSAAEPISLVSTKNPIAINALASQQELSFEPSGLTVIYGDNGSGKSGYVRVLKHACRSRDEKFVIHRDLEDKTDTPQSAEILFSHGSRTEQFAWTLDGDPHSDLPSVSIFDSRSASIHVESTNEVAYIPRPMRMLEALADASDRVKATLDGKIATLKGQVPLAISKPSLSSDTAAGSYVFGLTAKSNIPQLDKLAALSGPETARLATLETDFAQDPKRAVARLENHRSEVERIQTDPPDSHRCDECGGVLGNQFAAKNAQRRRGSRIGCVARAVQRIPLARGGASCLAEVVGGRTGLRRHRGLSWQDISFE